MKSKKQGIVSSESLGNSGCLMTLGKLPDSGRGKGFVCLFVFGRGVGEIL